VGVNSNGISPGGRRGWFVPGRVQYGGTGDLSVSLGSPDKVPTSCLKELRTVSDKKGDWGIEDANIPLWAKSKEGPT